MALNFRKYTHPFGSNRINFAEVDQLYTKNEILKISMGDQLDYFYTQCQTDGLHRNEAAYFFHTELLSPTEFNAYLKRFEANGKIRVQKLRENMGQLSPFEAWNKERRMFDRLKESRMNEYRFYGGMRLTLVFDQKSCFDKTCFFRAINYENLCKRLEKLLDVVLWKALENPHYRNIPRSSKHIEVIGFRNHNIPPSYDLYKIKTE